MKRVLRLFGAVMIPLFLMSYFKVFTSEIIEEQQTTNKTALLKTTPPVSVSTISVINDKNISEEEGSTVFLNSTINMAQLDSNSLKPQALPVLTPEEAAVVNNEALSLEEPFLACMRTDNLKK